MRNITRGLVEFERTYLNEKVKLVTYTIEIIVIDMMKTSKSNPVQTYQETK